MASPYELAGRAAKVTRLVDAMDAHFGRRTTRKMLGSLLMGPTVDQALASIFESAKVKSASQATVDALVRRIEERDAKFAEVANG